MLVGRKPQVAPSDLSPTLLPRENSTVTTWAFLLCYLTSSHFATARHYSKISEMKAVKQLLDFEGNQTFKCLLFWQEMERKQSKSNREVGSWWPWRGKHSERRLEALPPTSPSLTGFTHRGQAGHTGCDLWKGICYFSARPTNSQASLILISPFRDFSILNKVY